MGCILLAHSMVQFSKIPSKSPHYLPVRVKVWVALLVCSVYVILVIMSLDVMLCYITWSVSPKYFQQTLPSWPLTIYGQSFVSFKWNLITGITALK